MKIEWVHFPLHPETPAEGRSPEDLFRGRNVDRKAMHAQMKARMDAEGLPYGERTMTYNSRLAQELGDRQPNCGKRQRRLDPDDPAVRQGGAQTATGASEAPGLWSSA